MDSLDLDARAARRAGMSYGQWKVLHPHTAAINEAMISMAKKRRKKLIVPITCPVCGKTFVPPRAAQRFCSRECYRIDEERKRKNEYAQKSVIVRQYTKTCAVCGVQFNSRVKNRIYCSDYCRDAARAERLKELREARSHAKEN